MAAKKTQSAASPDLSSEAYLRLPADLTFEKALAELEEITEKLEDGKESLEASMKLYEHGLALKEFCEQKLKEAEGKWMMLKKQKDTVFYNNNCGSSNSYYFDKFGDAPFLRPLSVSNSKWYSEHSDLEHYRYG